jgi:DNA-3-methyladenine glycosylase II
MPQQFSHSSFHAICDQLAANDPDLAAIVRDHGYPPMWTRPNSFETLVHIILEQQVSLASALSALNKLREYVHELNPENILKLNDAEMRVCYVSRQKSGYIRYLAQQLYDGSLNLKELEQLEDDDIRAQLITLKGIGNWTIDVYLMFVLQRADIFPIGDLAAVNALKKVKHLPKETTREEMIDFVIRWQPYRTVATMLLWHDYLSKAAYREKIKV